MRKISKIIRTARKKVSKEVDPCIKVAYAILKLSQLKQRSKKARINPNTINQAVKQHFMTEGLENPPELDWGNMFKNIVKRLSRKNQWDRSHEEDILMSVFQDILLGENIDTGYQWSQGNLAQQIRDWRAEGKDSEDMRKLILRQINQRAIEKDRKRRERGESHAVFPFDPTYKEEQGETAEQLLLNMLDLDPMSRAEAQEWMSMSQGNREIRDFLRKVDKYVKSRASWETALIWEAVKDSPDYGKLTNLAQDEVTFRDPDTGQIKTMPLYKAIGQDAPRKIYYYFQKLEKLLEGLKDDASHLIQDSSRATG